MPITTFLFDLDGTLVDSVADLATGVNLLRDELSLPPLALGTVRSCVGDGATALVTRALPAGAFTPARLARFLELYGAHLLEQTRPYPGIVAFLEERRHLPLAVVTNKPLAMSLVLLRGLNLDGYFPVVVGGDSCAEKKPAAAPVLLALEELRFGRAGAVLIGDHHTDLRAGRAAGVATCFCTWGIGERDGLASDFTAATPAELPRLFPLGGA